MAPGNRAVFPREIPGFASPSRDGFALDGGHRGANVAPAVRDRRDPSDHAPVVPVADDAGQCAGAPLAPAGVGGRATSGPRPCIAATIAMAAPTPMSMSPTLKTLAIGTQVGIANRSVSGPRTTPSTRRLFE